MRKILTAGVALALGVGLLANAPGNRPVQASSHREAPLIKLDPTADNTDVYAFRSTETGRSGYVTLIANFIPFEEPAGGPHFYRFDDNAVYKIKIDNTGTGNEAITFEFRFQTTIVNPNTILGQAAPNQALGGSAGVAPLIKSITDLNYNEPQTYSVKMVTGGVSKGIDDPSIGFDLGDNFLVPPDNIGSRTTPNYEATFGQAAVSQITFPQSGLTGRVFAGQRAEGFYIDVESIFDTVNFHSLTDTGGIDTTAGFNVHSIAIEVPIQVLTRNGSVPTSVNDPNAVIGVWSTVERRAFTRRGRVTSAQVSRLGSPLVNELVIPDGLKDSFNASSPTVDILAAPFVLDPQLPKIMAVEFGAAGIPVNVPPPPRNDLVAIFATGIPAGVVPGFQNFLSDGAPHEYLRLNVAIPPSASPNRLGLIGGDPAGFPNGRRPLDDAVDIALRAMMGGTPINPNTPGAATNPFNVAPNNTVGDGVDHPSVPFLDHFPYLGVPSAGNAGGLGNAASAHDHHVKE